jgi:cysteinyl-tRNA synthetase
MITMTPRQKLDAEVEAIAAKYGLTVHEAVHVGKKRRRMIPRFEIYRRVVEHYGGNVAAAARYLEKDKTTVRSAMMKDVCNGQD